MNKNIYALLLVFSTIILAGCAQTGLQDVQWRCTLVDQNSIQCAEYQNGTKWAQDNCRFNGTDTVCPIVDSQTGEEFMVPVGILNLSALNGCARFTGTCIEETPYRTASYEVNLTQQ